MKTKLALILAGALALVGCGTPSQNIAMANAAGGNVYATYELGKAGTDPVKRAATVRALTDLAAELPGIPLGKVSAEKLGELNAELQLAKADLVTDPKASSQIGAIIALVSNNQGAFTQGAITPQEAIIFSQFQNVALGITNALQFSQGQQAVLNPGP